MAATASARHEGRVIFVRHALPGERVLVRITDDEPSIVSGARMRCRLLEPSVERVAPPCPIAGPGLCGGCDFQHVDLAAQRRLKSEVVTEQLRRLAGIDWAGEVEAIQTPGTADGLGWRTRMRYHVDNSGRAGLRAHRSHRIMPLPAIGCLIAHPRTPNVVDHGWPPGSELVAVAGSTQAALPSMACSSKVIMISWRWPLDVAGRPTPTASGRCIRAQRTRS